MTGLLRHVRKQIDPLPQNGPHQFAARHALVHYASGAVYSFIPKNACTALRYSLAIANGLIEGEEDFAWIHANNGVCLAQVRDLAVAPYSFVVLRCPYSRLASVFLDKFVALEPPSWAMRRALNDTYEPTELTFRDFVGHLRATSVRNADIHWRPQVEFLVYEDYSDWFAMEDFAAATARIEERTGMHVHDTRALARHGTDRFTLTGEIEFADTPVREIARMQRNGRSPTHAALYDADLVKAVSRIYASDIELYVSHFGRDGLLFPEMV